MCFLEEFTGPATIFSVALPCNNSSNLCLHFSCLAARGYFGLCYWLELQASNFLEFL